VAAACGGSNGATITGPTPPTTSGGTPAPAPSTGGTTITITATGMSPQALTVPVGSRVTFVNADNRPHDVAGGPDPSRPECPEIDVAGFMAPGQSRQTGVFTVARTCEYHDHSYIGVAAFQGRIVVQ
jgi:plastocyanin